MRLAKMLLAAVPLALISLAFGSAIPDLRRYLRMKRM